MKTSHPDNSPTQTDGRYSLAPQAMAARRQPAVGIVAMAPQQWLTEGFDICYSTIDGRWGPMLAASTPVGLCHLAFADRPDLALQRLRSLFAGAHLVERATATHQAAATHIGGCDTPCDISLHIAASPFQLDVYTALLTVDAGSTIGYARLAALARHPGAQRSVGTALSRNPVAVIVPCHRVVPACGRVGHYRWGEQRKAAMLDWERPHTL